MRIAMRLLSLQRGFPVVNQTATSFSSAVEGGKRNRGDERLRLVKHVLCSELPHIHSWTPSQTLSLCHPDVIFTDNMHNITLHGKRSLRVRAASVTARFLPSPSLHSLPHSLPLLSHTDSLTLTLFAHSLRSLSLLRCVCVCVCFRWFLVLGVQLGLMAFRQTLPLWVSQPSCQVMWVDRFAPQELHARWRIVGFSRTSLNGQVLPHSNRALVQHGRQLAPSPVASQHQFLFVLLQPPPHSLTSLFWFGL